MIESEWRTRLRNMIDLVFASAMTILIINFNIPATTDSMSSKEFIKILLNQSNNFSVFIISFLVISVYWVKNMEYYRMLKNIDKPIIWLHLLYLILVMMLPVANLIFTLFPSGIGIRVLFSIVMVLMGLITYSIMFYAHKKQYIDEVYDISYVELFTKQLLNEPVIAVIAAGLAFISPIYWDLSFILIPVAMALSKKIKVKLAKKSMKKASK